MHPRNYVAMNETNCEIFQGLESKLQAKFMTL